MLDVSGTVTILHSPGQDPEAFSADSVYDWSTVGKKMDAPDDQHAAVIYEPVVGDKTVSVQAPLHSVFFFGLCKWMHGCVPANVPFLRIINTHAKLLGACFHAPADHEAVTWLEDMKRTRHSGVSNGAHKDRHILHQAVEKETFWWDLKHFWALFAVRHKVISESQRLTQIALLSRLREF